VSGNREIYLIDSNGGIPQQITDHPGYDDHPEWLPGGEALLFTSVRDGEAGIWKIELDGSFPERFLSKAWEPAISPDGSKVAFCTNIENSGYSRIALIELSLPEQRVILTGDSIEPWDQTGPQWSPDGEWIAFSGRHNLWKVPSFGGISEKITNDDEYDFHPSWAPDGRHIYFSSNREGALGIWRTTLDGNVERLTQSTGSESSPEISRDGKYLTYATDRKERLIRIRDRTIDEEWTGLVTNGMASVSADGSRVVFVTNLWSVNYELGIQTLDGITPVGSPVRLTFQAGDASQPAFSNDGRWIAYYRIIDDIRDLWLTSSEGEPPVQLTDSPSQDWHPAWSPDDQWLAFLSDRDGKEEIWILSLSSGRKKGEPRKLSVDRVDSCWALEWSADGSLIFFVGIAGEETEVWAVPVDRPEEARQITHNAGALRIRWDQLSDALLVSGTWGSEKIRIRSIDPSSGEALRQEPEIVMGPRGSSALFDISESGRVLLYPEENRVGDIWILEAKNGVF
jgi:Tol biopolymer transport system component